MSANLLAESHNSTDTSNSMRTVLQLLVNLSRGSMTGFVAIVLSIAASGSWVNWGNVAPLFAFLICMAIGSHIIEKLCRKTSEPRSDLWAALAYTLGAAAGIAIFAADRSLGWFGHFTGV